MLFVVASMILVFAFVPFERNNIYLGSIIIISSITHLATFFLGGGFKNKLKIIDFVSFGLALLVSVFFYFFGFIDLEILVIVWGILDVIRNVAHIVSSVIECRENKLEIIEMAACSIEIVFSILLIFERSSGVTLHLIVMAIAYILCAIKFIIDFAIISYKEKRKEELNQL